jgi:hypothetical protein
MTTILIDGAAIEVQQLLCDPLPSGVSEKHVCLRLRASAADIRRLDGGLVPIVFPYGGTSYRGFFRIVGRTYESRDEASCTYVSEGELAEYVDQRWRIPLKRVIERWRRPG